MKSIRTEVLVIGGGPGGAIAARALARQGLDTLLLEKNLSFVKPCGGGITSTAFDELQLPALPDTKYVDTIKIVSPRDNLVPIRLTGASIAIVRRGDFDSALRREAEKFGARLLEGEFKHFADVGKTVASEVSLDGHNVQVKADYVIAADGVNSRVRAALSIKPVYACLTLTGKIKDEETDCCEFWFSSSHAPRFYSWVFPQKEGISLGTGSLNFREIKMMWQRFLERRALKINETHATGKGISLRGYRVPLWQGDLFARGNVLFVGDAAGQVLPLTYEGIYYAMKSGELAATAIAEGKIGNYKKLWEQNFRRRFSLMRRLWEKFLTDDNQAERLVQFCRIPEVQSASMRLWLKKEPGRESLRTYIHILRRLFIR
ncbi:MAG: NAD(P)/FAD-dependent oxidoreductase [Thermodesulfovibrionales bacterium]|jgi:geranylgeranyl reductase